MANGDHDFTAGEILTAANVDDYLMLQTLMKFATSAARDSALTTRKREGSSSIQDDSNAITVYSGAAWSTIGPVHGALTAWTPTLTQSGSVSVTNTSSFYIRIGRTVVAWFSLAVTGAGSLGVPVAVGSLPFAASATGDIHGFGEYFDNSVAHYPGLWIGASTTTANLMGYAQTNGVGQTPSFACASSDTLRGVLIYQAAADA